MRNLFLTLITCLFILPAYAKYSGGTGEPNDPYQIATAADLMLLGESPEDYDKHFKLMADIDLAGFTGTDFNIIGYWRDWYDTKSFTGVFDGNDHTISNFSYTSADTDFIGLFGYVGGVDMEIKDLGLIDPNVDAGTGSGVGSLVGLMEFGAITNCYVRNGNVLGNSWVGGLAGRTFVNIITDCYIYADVSGFDKIGGLVGENYAGIIKNCSSVSTVNGVAKVGGLVGLNEFLMEQGLIIPGYITGCCAEGKIEGMFCIGGLVGDNLARVTDSYATAEVIGSNRIGGLVGHNYLWTGTIVPPAVSYCYAVGSVSGSDNVGGLVGVNEGGTVTNSFWDIQTSGQITSAGGTGKATTEMQMEGTFTGAGWDFTRPIWTIDEGVDYPRLWWERQESSKYGGGSGTAEEPYLIHTSQQMNAIGANSNDWNKHFKLMEDINLSAFTGTDFNIIGYYISDDNKKPFMGVFNGNGHTISNFTYTSADRDFAGIFGYVDGANAKIKDLGLIDPNLDTNGWFVGSLVGYNLGGNINGCYTQGGTVSGAVRVGGLVGLNDGIITDCYSTCSVFGGGDVGGMVGLNASTLTMCYAQGSVSGITNVAGLVGQNDGTITACYATGSVTGTFQTAGGLVGFNQNGNISNCYATGSVEGYLLVGGLAGWNFGIITKCYSIGSVTGNREVGGLVGLNQNTVTLSCWNVRTSGQTTSSGGAGLTTSEMQIESIFINSGWDFINETANGTEDIWYILEGQGYPRFNWEIIEDEPGEVQDPLSEAMDTNLSFITGGDADWLSQTAISYYDEDAAQSGDITHEQESWLQTTVSGSGTVNFYWKVSSEENCDYLEFYIDGARQDRISGSMDWYQMTFEITGSDVHTLEWRYLKDESISRGDNCGWVDEVVWVPIP